MKERHAVGVDEAGYLLCLPEQALQAEYEAVVADACARLDAALPQGIHSLYLYGSVARGQGRPGASDLDLTLILRQPPSEAEAAVLQALALALAADHPVVTKVDFDLGTLDEVMAPESALRWGGWLKHYCRHLGGDDLIPCFPKLKPSRALAWAINGDCVATLSGLEQALAGATAEADIVRLQRMTARQLLRAAMVLRRDGDADWPQTMAQSVALALSHHPEQAAAWAYFLEQAERPRPQQARFLTCLQAYIRWLRQAMAHGV